jgi:hypothetical protein
MPFVPLTIPPGFVKSESKTSLMGRWVDGDKVRFYNGYPEKIGGAQKLTTDTFTGYVRGAKAWTSFLGDQFMLFGTQEDLYGYTDNALTIVTPFRPDANGIALTNPFYTTNGSAEVAVHDTAHGIDDVGVTVKFSGASASGGITVNGEYLVTEIVSADIFKIVHSVAATSTVAGGGGAVTAYYEINFGSADQYFLTGWGIGGWGLGGWGEPGSLVDAVIAEPRWWTFAEYGEDVIVCPINNSLFAFDTSGGMARPVAITGAPSQVRAVVVTPERYIFALGCTTLASDFDPMTVRWPHVDDRTDWTPVSTNTANERKLQGGTRLVAGLPMTGGVTLVWSDAALFAFQFTGSKFVYDSRMIASKCGLVGAHAACANNTTAYWMGQSGFHMTSGGGVVDIPNQKDIQKYILDNISLSQISKTVAFYNKDFDEVWWFYASEGAVEPDRYVMVNVETYAWATGTMERTAVAQFATGERRPILFTTDGRVLAHETVGDPNDDGEIMEAFIELAPTAVEGGEQVVDVMGFRPDMERQTGDLELYIYGLIEPRSATRHEQTKIVSDTSTLVDTRVSGRYVGIKLTSSVLGGDFRMNKCGLEITATSGRKR